jgi:hypothetical protein
VTTVTDKTPPGRKKTTKQRQAPQISLGGCIYNGADVIVAANTILKAEAPDLPPVTNPGQAVLVLGLHGAGRKGHELDYQEYEWAVIETGRSSYMPPDPLPFGIVATEAGAIRIVDQPQHFYDLVPLLYALFQEPLRLPSSAPAGIAADTHEKLSKAVYELEKKARASWNRSMLIAQYGAMFRMTVSGRDIPEEISKSTVSKWLAALAESGSLYPTGKARSTRYRTTPPPKIVQ